MFTTFSVLVISTSADQEYAVLCSKPSLCLFDIDVQFCLFVYVEVKSKAELNKTAATTPDRPVDISRLDIRVGRVISVEKVHTSV